METQGGIEQINKHCCGVASVVFEGLRTNPNLTQEWVLNEFVNEFPSWRKSPGLLRPCEILRLLDLIGLTVNDFIATSNIDEAVAAVKARSTFARLYWTRYWEQNDGKVLPTDHVMAVTELDYGRISLMNPTDGAELVFDENRHNKCAGTILLCFNHH